jgi:hypothetical protein
MDVEAGMTPRHDELDHFLFDFPFPQEHPQHFVLKELFQGLRVQCWGYLERSASIKSAIGAEHVAMGLEVQEIAEGLDRNDCPGSSLLFLCREGRAGMGRAPHAHEEVILMDRS